MSLLTRYGEKLDKTAPLPDYPRPQMVRDSFYCLNGPWQYAILKSDQQPSRWEGDILVPFCPESPLSGIQRSVMPDDWLWYRRSFSLPNGFKKHRVLLHFGAVDQNCTVWLNGTELGSHRGGFLPFHFDVTDALAEGQQQLVVRVNDPTDSTQAARGRQRLEHGGHWHSPVSGIWQTVWMESVPENHVRELTFTPLYDEHAVEVLVKTSRPAECTLEIFARRTRTATVRFQSNRPHIVRLTGAISWHPNNPFLYTVRLTCGQDVIDSYFGLRKIAVEQDEAGHSRIMLNNKPFFGAGVLSQGLYSDGLFTAPSDEAMLDDLKYAKRCGFNMVRAHGKVEPLRWYHHCDTLGLLVWQDVPAGGESPKPTLAERLFADARRSDHAYGRFSRDDSKERAHFLSDMRRLARLLGNTPSVGVWVLFQNGQGQFDAAQAAQMMKEADPLRLVDHASGRYDQGGGDILSLHLITPLKKSPSAAAQLPARAVVITEAGGIGLAPTPGGAPYAHRMANSREDFAEAIALLYRDELLPMVQAGACGFILSQLSDAGDEVSGLLSFDRRLQKVHPRGMQRLNSLFTG